MTAHPDAFNKVKNILGRLDRSIDEARAKRLHPGGRSENQPSADPLGGEGSTVIGEEEKPVGYGKAKPLRREDGGGFTSFRR